MSDKPGVNNSSYTPWNVNILNDDKIRVFGITLGKTTVQDANQIFSHFPATRFIENNGELQLYAVYQNLNFDGLIADIELKYQLDAEALQKLKLSAVTDLEHNQLNLPKEIESTLLNTPISSLLYKPSVDYAMDIILQRFGAPDSEQKISETITQWSYAASGLDIFIYQPGADIFIYSLPEKSKPIPATNSTSIITQ